MQRKRNGMGQPMLAEAIALLVRTEAALLAQVAETNKALAEGEGRFARIESNMEQAKTILRQLASTVEHHERMLTDITEAIRNLPRAVQQQIGFKGRN